MSDSSDENRPVVFDTNFFLYLSREFGGRNIADKIDNLVQELEQKKSVIILPSPCFAELLVNDYEHRRALVEHFEDKAFLRIANFDKKSAIELAELQTGAERSSSRQKVKYDLQIFAIAVVNKANTIYSDDHDLKVIAQHNPERNIQVFTSRDLPLPPPTLNLY